MEFHFTLIFEVIMLLLFFKFIVKKKPSDAIWKMNQALSFFITVKIYLFFRLALGENCQYLSLGAK